MNYQSISFYCDGNRGLHGSIAFTRHPGILCSFGAAELNERAGSQSENMRSHMNTAAVQSLKECCVLWFCLNWYTGYFYLRDFRKEVRSVWTWCCWVENLPFIHLDDRTKQRSSRQDEYVLDKLRACSERRLNLRTFNLNTSLATFEWLAIVKTRPASLQQFHWYPWTTIDNCIIYIHHTSHAWSIGILIHSS